MAKISIDGHTHQVSEELLNQVKQLIIKDSGVADILKFAQEHCLNGKPYLSERKTTDLGVIVFKLPICNTEWTFEVFETIKLMYDKYKNKYNCYPQHVVESGQVIEFVIASKNIN